MDSIYGEDEEYFGKCGELFLTTKGNIAFHCTLCEGRFKGFKDYNDHILETHYAPDFKEEVLTDSLNEEDTFDPLSEDAFGINADEFLIKEENVMESCVSPETFHRLVKNQNEDTAIESLAEKVQTEDSNKTLVSDISIDEEIRPTIRSVNVKETIKDRKYKCPYCGFTGADKSNMRGHIRRHSMNKPHKCTACEKAFYTRTELNTHIRSHTGERPFLCNLCGKSFTTSSKLCNHQKRHNNKRDKECSICKMRFFDMETLRGHMTVHSDKRNYKCTKCDASFKQRMPLRNHMKLHDNKREYQCKLCDSKFNQHAGLYSHMKSCHTVVSKSSKASASDPDF